MTKKRGVGNTKQLIKNIQDYFDLSDAEAAIFSEVIIKIFFKTLAECQVIKNPELGIAEIFKTNTLKLGSHYVVRVHPSERLKNSLRGLKADSKSSYRTLNKLIRVDARMDEINKECSDVKQLADKFLSLTEKYDRQQLMALLSERVKYSNRNEDTMEADHTDSKFLGEFDD